MSVLIYLKKNYTYPRSPYGVMTYKATVDILITNNVAAYSWMTFNVIAYGVKAYNVTMYGY